MLEFRWKDVKMHTFVAGTYVTPNIVKITEVEEKIKVLLESNSRLRCVCNYVDPLYLYIQPGLVRNLTIPVSLLTM